VRRAGRLRSFAETYGLTTTPTYFLLDKDKKFIAKPESLEELESYLERVN